MRQISFFLTTWQFRNRTKTVTRRNGWRNLKAGDVLMAVVKGQGLKRGQRVEKLGPIRILSVRREPLNKIDRADVRREGFPSMTPAGFVEMYCRHNKCKASRRIRRIEYEYLAGEGSLPPLLDDKERDTAVIDRDSPAPKMPEPE